VQIWDTLFRDVHGKEFVRVINTCPEWNHLLSSRKTMELFAEVLPFVMEWLPKMDFLNLRLISRGWKEGLDKVYENHTARLASATSNLTFPELAEEDRVMPFDDNGMRFDTLEGIQTYLKEVDVDSGNPFPGRCVWFSLEEHYRCEVREDEEEYMIRPEFLQSFAELLTRFGKHIWYLQLDFVYQDINYFLCHRITWKLI